MTRNDLPKFSVGITALRPKPLDHLFELFWLGAPDSLCRSKLPFSQTLEAALLQLPEIIAGDHDIFATLLGGGGHGRNCAIVGTHRDVRRLFENLFGHRSIEPVVFALLDKLPPLLPQTILLLKTTAVTGRKSLIYLVSAQGFEPWTP